MPLSSPDGRTDSAGTMRLRLAIPGDADALFIIHQDAINTFSAASYGPERMRIWFEGRTSVIYDRAIAEGRVWLAEADGRILGFVGIKPGEIDWLYVRPDASGRGIGRMLVERGIVEAGKGGPVKVTSLLNAESFYRRRGFVKLADSSFTRGDPVLEFPVVKLLFTPDH